MSLVPPSAHGRPTSPTSQPQLRLPRQNAPMTARPQLQHRRRLSQVTSLGSHNEPVTRIRSNNEHRSSFDYDVAKQRHDDHDDTGIETDDTDYLEEHVSAEGYHSSDSS